MAEETLGEVDSSEIIVIIPGKIIIVKQTGFIAGEQAVDCGIHPVPFSEKGQVAFMAFV